MSDTYDLDAFRKSLVDDPPQKKDPLTPDVYDLDAFRKSIQKEKTDALNHTLEATVDTKPDEEASNVKLGEELGLPSEVVGAESGAFNRKKYIEDVKRHSSDTPVLRDRMTDYGFASVAHDDVENLSVFERVINSYKRGSLLHEQGILGYKYRSSRDPAMLERIKANQRRLASLGDLGSGFASFLEGAAEILGQQIASITSEDAALLIGGGATTGAAIGAAGGPLAPITSSAGALTGMGAGYLSHLAIDSMKVEGGLAFIEQLEAGIDPEVAKWGSLGVGVINAGLEMAGALPILKPISTAGKRMLKISMKEAVKRATVVEAAKTFAKTYGKGVAAETLTEILQEGVNITAEEIGKSFTDAELKSVTKEEVVDRLAMIAEKTFKGMVLLGLPGPSANFVMDARKARSAAQNERVFAALGNSAEASKLRDRLPDRYRAFVDAVKEKYGDIDDVYVNRDALVTLMQSDEYSGIFGEIEGFELTDAIADSETTGQSVAIPLEVYHTYIAPTEAGRALNGDVKFAEDDLTANEAKTRMADAKEIFDAEYERAMEQDAADRETASPLDFVYDNVYSQLLAAGRVPAQARHEAALHRAHARVLMEYGEDPQTYYGEFAIKGPLPTTLKSPIDDLDLIIDRARRGVAMSDRKLFGESLQEMARRYGIKDDRGDLRSQDVDVNLKPFQRKMLREDGITLDDFMVKALEAGFFPEVGGDRQALTTDDVIQALTGEDVYVEGRGDQAEIERVQAADDLLATLNRLGIDLDAPNEAIKKALLESEPRKPGERYLSQAGDKNIGEIDGKRFWIGAVSLLDGEIEETYTYEQAEEQDFHHSFLVSEAQQERIRDGESVMFWIDDRGVQSMVGLPPAIEGRIREQITIHSPSERTLEQAAEYAAIRAKYSIDPEEVPVGDWAGRVLFHGTSMDGARSIVTGGIDNAKSSKGYFGRGFYLASDAELAENNYADFAEDDAEGVTLPVRVSDGARILDLRSPEDWEVYQPFAEEVSRNNFDQIMRDNGIDGIFDRSFGGVVIYNPDVLEVIPVGGSRSGDITAFNQAAQEFGVTPEELAAELEKAGGDITQTPLFRAWFRNGKVVDENGKPLVVYFGGASDIEAFDPSYRGESTNTAAAREAFFFTDDPSEAGGFADFAARGKPSDRSSGTNIMPVYLNLQNPLVVRATDGMLADPMADIIKKAKSGGHDGVIFRGVHDSVQPPGLSLDGEFLNIDSRGMFWSSAMDYFEELQKNEDAAAEYAKEIQVDLNATVNDMASELDAAKQTGDQYEIEYAEGELDLWTRIRDAWADDPSRFAIDAEGQSDVYAVFDPTQIKSVFNRGTFDPNDPRILYQSAARYQVDPLDVDGTGPNGRVRKQDVARRFTELHMANEGRVLDPINSQEDFDYVLEQMAAEYEEQKQQYDDGLGWYTADIARAIEITRLLIPELGSPIKRDLFMTLAAITSPRERPNQNWEKAIDAMQQYVRDGIMPDRKQNGLQFGVNSIASNIKLLQYLIDQMGEEGALEWLKSEHTGAEMADIRRASGLYVEGKTRAYYTPSEMNLKSEALGVYMFGPKVGDFFLNASGTDHTAVTVDMWLAQTYNRHIGRLLDIGPKALADGNVANELRSLAERETIKKLIRTLAEREGVDPSAVQAALWYFEQRLERSHGLNSQSQSFAGAAEKAARAREIEVPTRGSKADGRGVGDFAPQAATAPGVITQYQNDARHTRGFINFLEGGGVEIGFNPNADLSTFLHESSHFFIRNLTMIAERNEKAAADLATLMKFAGVESIDALNQTEPQEKLARAFEAYFREGKAPSAELQGAFAAFKSWMLTVYRTLRGLGNVELSDDVRGVFDRLLATEEEIAEAEQVNEFLLMPDVAELMNDGEFSAYQRAAAVAREKATLELEQRKIAEKTREETARWKEEYGDIRADVAASVNARPVFRAIDAIRDKSNDLYLNRDTAVDLVGEEGLERIPKGLVRKSGGYHPDIIAEQFGFSSGHEMLMAMMNAAKNKTERNKLIDGLAMETMVERHGSLNENAAQAAEAASEIVHSDERGLFLAMELRVIARASGKEATPANVAKAAAQRIMAQKPIKDAVQVGKYAAAEVRFAKEATRALLKKDIAAAEEAKRHQLLNHYLFMEARKARDEVDGMVSYFGKFRRRSKTIDPGYLDQIDGLLERYEFRRSVSMREARRRQSLAEFVSQQNAADEPVSIPDDLLDEMNKRHYRDASLEELRGLHDTVRHLEKLGRMKDRLQTLQAQRDLNKAVGVMASSIRANWVGKTHKRSASKTKIERGMDWAKVHLSPRKIEFLMRELDGFKPGPMQEMFWNIISKGDDNLQIRRMDAADSVREIFRHMKWRDAKDIFTRKTYIQEIDDSLTKETMLAAALNMGTHDNKAKWLKGWGWSSEGLDAVLDRLTKEDWDMVQAMWDYLGTFWDETYKLNERTLGKNPPKIDATPVETKFGTYRGGYYPISYELDPATRTLRNSNEEIYKSIIMGDSGRPITNLGRTKERIDSGITPEELAAGLPASTVGKNRIRTDLGVFFEAIENTIHDLAFREPARDASKILKHPDMIDVLHETIGETGYQTLVNWLRDGVSGGVQTNPQWVDKVFAHIRKRTTTGAMGFKLSTMFLQPLGYTQAVARLIEDAGPVAGAGYARRAVTKFYNNPSQMIDFIQGKSDFMISRPRTWDRDAMAVMQSLQKGPVAKLEASYFWHIAKAQLAVDFPAWLAAYEWYSNTYPENGDQAASDYGDSVVRMTQGAGAEKDLAPIQKGGEFTRNFNLFMTFFSSMTNMVMDQGKQMGRNITFNQATIFSTNMLLISVVPVVLEKMIYNLLGVQGPDEDDDESMGEWLFKEWVQFAVGGLPGVRDAVSAWVGDYPFEITPTAATIKSAVDFPKQIIQAFEEDEIDRGLVKTGAAFANIVSPVAIPVGQTMLIGDYLVDWFEEGEAGNPAELVRRKPRYMRDD